jgi:hypothetical protein
MKFKQALRWAGFALLMLLALCGIGPPPNLYRPKDFENEVKIELVEKKRDEDISDVDNQKEVNQ